MSGKLIRFHEYLRANQVFLYIYFASIACIIVGMFFSRALLSIGQISMAANWLLEGGFPTKWQMLKRNREAFLFAGLYLVHVLWLFNTDDLSYAAKDLRIKMPILLFPIVFASTNLLAQKRFRNILSFFLLAIFTATAAMWYYYFNHDIGRDAREVSFLFSHIRFALMLCLAVSVSIYFTAKFNSKWSLLFLGLSLYFTFFMLYFIFMTGIVILVALILAMFLMYLRRSNSSPMIRRTIFAFLALVFILLSGYIWISAKDYVSVNRQKEVVELERTMSGRPYHQWYRDFGYTIRENGYLVYQNVSFEEIKGAWNARSEMKVDYMDGIEEREDVLLRYLASKGLPKDSLAIAMLSDAEVKAIEQGVTNVNYVGKPEFYQRLFNTFWQIDTYLSGGNFNEHSFGMRMEFWKTGMNVIKRHFWFGTGTGDIENEFQVQYELDQTSLLPEYRYRSHNQFISIWATFGIFGFLYFLIVVFYPAWLARTNFLYTSFFLIFFLSMLPEDTLETQMGISFYTFFNSLLFFGWRKRNQDSRASSTRSGEMS